MSVNIVNQTTGELTPVAGNATDKVGNLDTATTTDKSSVVAMVNEVNWKAGTFGIYTITNATDIKDFIKKLITQADADLASKPAYMLFNIFAVYSNVDVFYGTIERQDAHSYCFSLSNGAGNKCYKGRIDLSNDYVEVHEFVTSEKSYSGVNLDPTYDASTDWNIVKQGNICVMNMRNLKDIPTGNTVIGTIPVGFRPEWGFYEYVYAANKDVHLGFNIGSDGQITIINSTGSAISGSVYVNRNITYFTA